MKNIDRLAQIKTTDLLFWLSLTDIAYLIKREGSTFIDDYALEVRSLPTIIICQTVKTETNSVLQNSDDGDTSDPVGWVTPGPYLSGHFKHQLYVSSDAKLHKQSYAIGRHLNNSAIISLITKGVVVQHIGFGHHEINFVLSTPEFIEYMTQREPKLV